jgi:conserved oligomeric Golgi complex subunit 6
LTFLSGTRQATVLSTFIIALTCGGPSGYPRPIELHAHDPLRYVGDMLAWVHQSIAVECEFLESLFGLRSDGRTVGSIRMLDSKEDEEDWIHEWKALYAFEGTYDAFLFLSLFLQNLLVAH